MAIEKNIENVLQIYRHSHKHSIDCTRELDKIFMSSKLNARCSYFSSCSIVFTYTIDLKDSITDSVWFSDKFLVNNCDIYYIYC